MRLLAIFGTAATGALGLMLLIAACGPETLLPAMIAVSTLSSATLRLLLGRYRSLWSARRSIVVSAGVFPSLVWLLALAFDISGVIQYSYHPDEGFMMGLSIMLFPVCIVGFVAGLVSAALVRPRTDATR